MDTVEAGCIIKIQDDGSFLLLPRNDLDKSLLNSFIDNSKGRFVNVRLMNRAQAKTYDQTKAFWALAGLHYRAFNDTYATSKELEFWYEDLLKPELFPTRKSTVKESAFVPKGWSELTKEEGIEVISKMVALIADKDRIPDSMLASVKDVFEWLQNEKNSLYKDPTDYHPDGTPLTTKEWSENNKICMCTGTIGGDICHIVSKEKGKGFEWLINQPWNYYRASHDIHLNIQHQMGWEYLFNGVPSLKYYGAPWLKPRYERALRMFDEGVRLTHEGYPQEEILKKLGYSDCEEHDQEITKYPKPKYDNRSLAQIAAEQEVADCDIF